VTGVVDGVALLLEPGVRVAVVVVVLPVGVGVGVGVMLDAGVGVAVGVGVILGVGVGVAADAAAATPKSANRVARSRDQRSALAARLSILADSTHRLTDLRVLESDDQNLHLIQLWGERGNQPVPARNGAVRAAVDGEVQCVELRINWVKNAIDRP
jgi:hypothetical protein